MADKSTQLIVAALSRAATEPDGIALFATKSEPGLFPSGAVARQPAERCKTEGYLEVLRAETKGKATREICRLTPKGLHYLVRQTSPREVLEDFVRALEARHEDIQRIFEMTRAIQSSLEAMGQTAREILPQIPTDMEERLPANLFSSPQANGSAPPRAGLNGSPPTPTRLHVRPELRAAVLAEIADWHTSAGASEDCPLPELYRRLTANPSAEMPTLGEFHDCLRQLHEDHELYLHPWTGPLYELPEPAFALLIGHEIAYYANIKMQNI